MGKIKFIQIEPTTRCNYNCVFCCGRYMQQKDMDFDVFKRVVDEYKDVVEFQIQGEGEPMLHPQFFEMVKYAKKAGKRVKTISNGSLFTEANIEKILDAEIDLIYLSIEATNKELYKEIRGGDYDVYIENIKRFYRMRNERKLTKPVLGFGVTIMKKTKNMMPDIIELYKELGMDGGITYHFLNRLPFYMKYYGDKVDNQVFSRAETRYMIYEIDQLIAQSNLLDLSGTQNGSDYENMGNCAWLDHGIYINVNGNAMRCAFDKEDSEFTYGNVMECSVSEIMSNKEDFVSGKVPQPATLNCEQCHVFRRY